MGERLRPVPLAAICHGPLPRAAQTAAIIADVLPGVPVSVSELAGDYVPPADDGDLPARHADFLASYTRAERARGGELARAALDRFTAAGPAGGETHELVVTHNFLIGWLASQVLGAPSWRWLGLNQMNAGLTVIAYPGAEAARLISFNDAAHLPPALRWTGFPAAADGPGGLT